MSRPAKEKSAAKLAEYYKTAADKRKAAKATVAIATDGEDASQDTGATRLADFNGVPQTSNSNPW